MRAIEFEAHINNSGELEIPREAITGLPSGAQARVIVLLPEDDDISSETWNRFAEQNISQYYGSEDAIYDNYPRG
jgi:hypothetical protein